MAFGQPRIEYKTNAQMRTMHEAGLVLSRALDAAVAAAVPGATTKHLDDDVGPGGEHARPSGGPGGVTGRHTSSDDPATDGAGFCAQGGNDESAANAVRTNGLRLSIVLGPIAVR